MQSQSADSKLTGLQGVGCSWLNDGPSTQKEPVRFLRSDGSGMGRRTESRPVSEGGVSLGSSTQKRIVRGGEPDSRMPGQASMPSGSISQPSCMRHCLGARTFSAPRGPRSVGDALLERHSRCPMRPLSPGLIGSQTALP